MHIIQFAVNCAKTVINIKVHRCRQAPMHKQGYET